MGIWHLLLVALVQGLTEYLPVSSSAHLILLPRVLGEMDQGLPVDVAAHTGTFLAAVVYFRSDLLRLGRSLRAQPPAGASQGSVAEGADTGARRDRVLLRLILIASAPVLVVGFLLRDVVATTARDPALIATSTILFGLVLGYADRTGRRRLSAEDLGTRGAVFVGLAQMLALIPGTSRSGVTISAGLLRGLGRDEAARFSFLISIPVSAAVAVSELMEMASTSVTQWARLDLLLVAVVAGVVGHLCIGVFLRLVREHSLMPFVVYRVVLGAVVLLVFH